MPQLADGSRRPAARARPPAQERRHGIWAVFKARRVRRSPPRLATRTRRKISSTSLPLQGEARNEGFTDARFADVVEILDYYDTVAVPRRQPHRARTIRARLRRVRPHLIGKRLHQLDDALILGVMQEMAKTLAPATVETAIQEIRTAIRFWCLSKSCTVFLPFEAPRRSPGRNRVLTAKEQAIALRWADGDEDYDPKTRLWTPARRPLTERERHYRDQFGRLVRLGLGTGSRPGRIDGLAWGPNFKFGWIDMETGTLHRCPLGAPAPRLKQAPPMILSPELMRHVRAWREADGDQRYLIRTFAGEPAVEAARDLFRRIMAALGIRGVSRHTLRHTAITGAVAEGVPASVIAATVGISLDVLQRRYNHSDARVIQPLAHAGLDRLLREGIAVID